VIDTGRVEIALISRHVEPSDLNCFYTLGIDPDAEALRDAEEPHPWRAGLGPMAKAVVECAGLGVWHVGLFAAYVHEYPPPDLPARSAEPVASGYP